MRDKYAGSSLENASVVRTLFDLFQCSFPFTFMETFNPLTRVKIFTFNKTASIHIWSAWADIRATTAAQTSWHRARTLQEAVTNIAQKGTSELTQFTNNYPDAVERIRKR